MERRGPGGRGRGVAGVALVASCAALSPAPRAAADEPAAKPPAQDPMAAEVEAIRRLTAIGSWKAAKGSIDRFFAAHADDARVLAVLPAVESDLEKASFRLDGPQPSTLELLGRGAVKYDATTSRAEFAITGLAESDGWRRSGDVVFFDALFDGDVSVELSADMAYSTTVMLGFDAETRGGFAFVPVNGDYGRQPNVYRLDPGAKEPELLGDGSLLFLGGTTTGVTYSMSGSKVTVDIRYTKEWNPRDRKSVRSFSAGKPRRGFAALARTYSVDPGALRIEGRLDATFAKRQIAEADAARFRKWRESRWKRETALPAWVLATERRAAAWTGCAPAGWPEAARDALVLLSRAAFESPGATPARVPGLTGRSAAWEEALRAFAEGRPADAEAAARRVLGEEAEFAPAHALVGRALLRRGDDAAAVAAFDAAKRLDAAFAPAHDGLALAAFRAGDLDAMEARLGEAASAGCSSALTSDLRGLVLRARRGPDWKKSFDVLTPDFLIQSDTGLGVCNDVAKVLQESMDVYARQFRRRPAKLRARVRVFSGFASYADYVSDLGANPDNSLGMYLPRLRELCVWLNEDRPELWNTVRHEAFHQYIHQFADDVPIWFNEGYAEFFGFSRRKMGKALVGQVDESQASLARALLPKFTPLADLFRMEPAPFMEKAGVHYVQSWAVIHFLRETADPALAGILDRYFDALLAGRGRDEAYAEVLAPHVGAIESGLETHVKALKAK